MPHHNDNALRLRFNGGRFNDGSIPLSVLPSFSHLEALIADLAWQEYSRETGAKKRNKAFIEAMDLQLSDIEVGSAVAIIRPSSPNPMMQGFNPLDEFRERSIKRIHQAISVAESGSDAGSVIEPELLSKFDHILPDLRNDESVEFPASLGPEPDYAVMTQTTRDNIIKASKAKTVVERGSIYAFIPEINKRTSSFELQAVDGSIRQKVKFQDSQFKTLRDAWESYRRDLAAGNPVLVVGELEVSQLGALRNIKCIEAINQLDPLDVRARLQQFKSLRDGWFDGEGTQFPREFLHELADRFDRWYPTELQKPAIFPHADGTIGCEWSLPKGECILTVDPSTDTADWIDFSPRDESDEKERVLDLGSDADWKWLSERVAARKAEITR